MELSWSLLGLTLLLLLLLWSKRQLIILGCSLPGPWAMPLLGNAQMIGKLKPECKLIVTVMQTVQNDSLLWQSYFWCLQNCANALAPPTASGWDPSCGYSCTPRRKQSKHCLTRHCAKQTLSSSCPRLLATDC